MLLIYGCLQLSPRLASSGILNSVRLDDLLLPITAVLALKYLRERKFVFKATGLFLVLMGMGAVVASITHTLAGANEVSLFYKLLPLIKSLQFIIYFAFFLAAASQLARAGTPARTLLVALVLPVLPNLGYALYQIGTLQFKGVYGLATLSETSASLVGGTFYLAAALLASLIVLENRRNYQWLWRVLFGIAAAATFLTASRGSALALVNFCALWWGLPLLRRPQRLAQYTGVGLLLAGGVTAIVALLPAGFQTTLVQEIDRITRTAVQLYSSLVGPDAAVANLLQEEARFAHWQSFISEFQSMADGNPLIYLFGLGSGGIYEILGTFMNAADSQIVYVFLSGGFLGLGLYIVALLRLFALGKTRLHRRFRSLEPVFLALFGSFMGLTVTAEVLNISKTGGLFSATMGMLLGLASAQALPPANPPGYARAERIMEQA